MKLEFPRRIFEKYLDIKFHEYLLSGSRVVACGRMDSKYEANNRLLQYYECAEQTQWETFLMTRRRRKVLPLYLTFCFAFVIILFLRSYLQPFFSPSQYSSKLSYFRISISSSIFCYFLFILSCPPFSSLYFLLFLSSTHPG